MAFLIELRGCGSSGIWYLGKLVGALIRDFGVSSEAEDTRLMDEARENPFLNSVQLKRNTAFPGCPRTVIKRNTEAGLGSRSAAVKNKLSEEHRLYRFALAEDNVDRDWGNVIFSDESVLSSPTMGRYECIDLRGSVTMQNT
jgi:hypothetical protein